MTKRCYTNPDKKSQENNLYLLFINNNITLYSGDEIYRQNIETNKSLASLTDFMGKS